MSIYQVNQNNDTLFGKMKSIDGKNLIFEKQPSR